MHLTDLHIQQAENFAIEFSNADKSSGNFGSKKIRNKQKIIDDVFEGKLGEFAFQEMCREYGIEITLDNKVVKGKRNNDEGQDIILINGIPPKKKYDIKTTKEWSKWFIIESHKASEEIIKPDMYIMVKVDLDSYYSSYVGLIHFNDLFDEDKKPWFDFNNKKRNRLYNPSFVDECWSMAFRKYGKVTKRSQIYEFMKKLNNIYEPYMRNGKLDAPKNYALPLSFINYTNIEYIIDILKGEV
jgi:hypothetical protein